MSLIVLLFSENVYQYTKEVKDLAYKDSLKRAELDKEAGNILSQSMQAALIEHNKNTICNPHQGSLDLLGRWLLWNLVQYDVIGYNDDYKDVMTKKDQAFQEYREKKNAKLEENLPKDGSLTRSVTRFFAGMLYPQ